MSGLICLQEYYSPQSRCFGCGPGNELGLKIQSLAPQDAPHSKGVKIAAHWRAQPHHQAFPGVVNGGIIGALLDCHSNWTAAWALMVEQKQPRPPCTVTASYSVQLLRPTPSETELTLEAWVKEISSDRATIDATLSAKGKLCARCEGVFVAVSPGHPAYHRW